MVMEGNGDTCMIMNDSINDGNGISKLRALSALRSTTKVMMASKMKVVVIKMRSRRVEIRGDSL